MNWTALIDDLTTMESAITLLLLAEYPLGVKIETVMRIKSIQTSLALARQLAQFQQQHETYEKGIPQCKPKTR